MGEGTLSKLINVQQLAQKLGVPKWTVRAMTRKGLPYIKLAEKFFFRESDVEAGRTPAREESGPRVLAEGDLHQRRAMVVVQTTHCWVSGLHADGRAGERGDIVGDAARQREVEYCSGGCATPPVEY